jgi:3-hydroxyisobutyrate dehydrogenase-like beta-hydroxyacid dehydrogenase
MKVGFIGLGSMGTGMSRNLIKAGHDLVVYNRTRSRVQEMQSLGAKVADSPSEAAVGAEALITMLADDRAVQDVIFEPGAAIESLPEGAVHISMSTISVDLSRKLAKSHADKYQNSSELYCGSCLWPTGRCDCGRAVHCVGGAK